MIPAIAILIGMLIVTAFSLTLLAVSLLFTWFFRRPERHEEDEADPHSGWIDG